MGMSLALALFSSLRWKKRVSKAARRVRGRKRLRREEDLVAPEITLDLMIEILTRLPAKSLMRFKCVSKLWFSLIRSRYFTNLCMVASPPRPRLYLNLIKNLECDSMEVCPHHKPGKSLLVSFSSSSSNIGESFDQDLTLPFMGGHDMVVLRGLILHMVCKKACIHNPNTRQNVTLPTVKSDIFAQEGFEKGVYYYYFFGHDHVLDQYKVVCTVVIYSKDLLTIVTSEHWVFVLEVGGIWKRIEFNQHHHPKEVGLCINGVIYYLAETSMSHNIVVSFDVRSEEFGMIRAPNDVSEFYDYVAFIEYSGKPTIFYYTHLFYSGLVELWGLEDGGKWSKKSLVLQPCQMHLVDDINLIEVGTTQNGEVILAPFSLNYILYYDLHKNDLRKVEIRGVRKYRFIRFNLRLMDKSESIMHLET